ncbi:hypothetical protein LPJGGPFB_04539 [Ensifer adhaerens]|uniref:Uncharacterized protein n=1 Tax=Ensifer adhaerens TaxID=106592 RepID=A0ACC5T4L5_ENSAD|nr:hypothetical protein [Ensifer adhaerens]NRP21280.1 hypothetical protein [Ensifer adhaerens]
MRKSLHNFLAAGLLAVGALSALSSTSSAQSLDLYIGPDGRPDTCSSAIKTETADTTTRNMSGRVVANGRRFVAHRDLVYEILRSRR